MNHCYSCISRDNECEQDPCSQCHSSDDDLRPSNYTMADPVKKYKRIDAEVSMFGKPHSKGPWSISNRNICDASGNILFLANTVNPNESADQRLAIQSPDMLRCIKNVLWAYCEGYPVLLGVEIKKMQAVKMLAEG